MKTKLSVSAMVSVAALTSSVLFASVNPALSCPFSKFKGTNTSSLTLNPPNLNQIGKIGAGFAIAASALAIAGWLVSRRATKLAQMSQEDSFKVSSFRISVPPEALEMGTEASLEVEEHTSIS